MIKRRLIAKQNFLTMETGDGGRPKVLGYGMAGNEEYGGEGGNKAMEGYEGRWHSMHTRYRRSTLEASQSRNMKEGVRGSE